MKLFSMIKHKWRDYNHWVEKRISHFEKSWFVYFPTTRAYMKFTRAYFKFGVPVSLLCVAMLFISFFNSSAIFFKIGLADINLMFFWTLGMLCWEQVLKYRNERREWTIEQSRPDRHTTSYEIDADNSHATDKPSHSGLSLSLSEKEGLVIEELLSDIFNIQKPHQEEQTHSHTDSLDKADIPTHKKSSQGSGIEKEKEIDDENRQ